MEEENVIYFFDDESKRVKEEHYYLNNYHPSLFVINGIEYKTVEHSIFVESEI